jgi:SAM-dependent methyltransferase
MNEEIEKEIGIHGDRWEGLHQGYFSDPAISRHLVEEIISAVEVSDPTVLVDLGGGTGYLLSEVLKRGINPDIRLINLDLSLRQLNRTGLERIKTLEASLAEFQRPLIASDSDRVLFFMRSALHYFGQSGLGPVLCHLREQMKKGEYFIHQTACFTSRIGADCLNTIYAGMGTTKWYPLVSVLIPILESTGWEIISISDVPRLRLASDELKERYRLTDDTVRKIRESIMKDFGEIEGVLEETNDGFIAYLSYKIFRCRAKDV